MPALDIEQPAALIDYLRETSRIAPDESPRVQRLAGGVSNRTMLVTRDAGEAWVVKQALAKLRVAVDWFSDPARIHREAAGLRYLEKVCPPGSITPLVFEDDEHHLLAMQAVAEPHENWKTMLLAGDLHDDHVDQFADILAAIHSAPGGEQTFDDRGYFESLRLEPYYTYTGTQVSEAAAFYSGLVASNRARRLAVVHGDYSPKNVLVRGGRLILLDHEVIHFGDPAFDLGFAMTHLLSKAHHVRDHRDAFADAAVRFWLRYHGQVNFDDLEPHAVRNTLGCLLARVAGRSTLEYMSEEQRAVQRRTVLKLINNFPQTVDLLVRRFIAELLNDQ